MAISFLYRCTDCGAEYPADGIRYLCPECSITNVAGQPPKGVLKTIYPYEVIRGSGGADLFGELESKGFLPLLPLKSLDAWPKLRVGNTPLYEVDRFFEDQHFGVFFKDDSQNPTFSFKDRASALVSAWAKENGITTLIAASTGNAGSSLAGVCASQGQRTVIMVPATAPLAKLTQIMMYGATIVPVKGTYDMAFDLSVKATEQYGFYNRNTAFNPLTIEGKKTVSFELFSQLGRIVPDRVFVPTGDGVILSGVYKGFEDLLELGIIDRMPVVVAVQAEGSCNLAANLYSDSFTVTPSTTLADSISVDVPRNFRMSAGYLKQYRGETVTVTDEEILQASKILASKTGIFTEPAAAAAVAGMIAYNNNNNNRLPESSKNVVLVTGSGLKDLKAVQPVLSLPEPVDPDTDDYRKILDNLPA